MINDSNGMADIIHIYTTNAKRNALNALKLKATFTNVNVLYSLIAIDSTLTPELYKNLRPTFFNSTFGIPPTLKACKEARITLYTNVDIAINWLMAARELFSVCLWQ